MKITSITTKKVYDLELSKSGENQMPCPECSQDRKKKTQKCFSFNVAKGAGYCNHCEARFVEFKPYEKIEYVRPKWENFTDLSDDMAKKFEEKRRIGQTTLRKMRISTKKIWMPQTQTEENVICFPFFVGDDLVNVKYRGSNKSFKLESGAELIWYNYNALFNHKEIIITEGEIDCLSFIQEGFNNCISVPNGASIGKMEYFDSSIDVLDRIEKFYIAVDNDEKGILLRDELIRRLGADRCYVCTFKEYKDGNDYLIANGYGSLSEVLTNAKQPTIEGVYDVADFTDDLLALFNDGLKRGLITGFRPLDDLVSWETKRLAIWTGTPGSGKSEFIDEVNVRLNIAHGWKVAYWSPENFPMTYHYAKIYEKVIGRQFKKDKSSEDEYWLAWEYIKSNFFWINPESNTSLENIIAKFKLLVKTKGVKVCVLDPFNKIENEVEYSKQGKLLDQIINFARQYDVLFHLVAHPRKLTKDKDGTYPMPTLYDIAGSSDFWNKADYGIAIRREQDAETKAFVNEGYTSVQKVKFKHLGEQGVFEWKYNLVNGRYEEKFKIPSQFDNSNRLLAPVNANAMPPLITGDISAFEAEKEMDLFLSKKRIITNPDEIPF